MTTIDRRKLLVGAFALTACGGMGETPPATGPSSWVQPPTPHPGPWRVVIQQRANVANALEVCYSNTNPPVGGVGIVLWSPSPLAPYSQDVSGLTGFRPVNLPAAQLATAYATPTVLQAEGAQIGASIDTRGQAPQQCCAHLYTAIYSARLRARDRIPLPARVRYSFDMRVASARWDDNTIPHVTAWIIFADPVRLISVHFGMPVWDVRGPPSNPPAGWDAGTNQAMVWAAMPGVFPTRPYSEYRTFSFEAGPEQFSAAIAAINRAGPSLSPSFRTMSTVLSDYVVTAANLNPEISMRAGGPGQLGLVVRNLTLAVQQS